MLHIKKKMENLENPGKVTALYSVQCTVYSVQCTVYSVQCIVYIVQCTVHSLQCMFTVCSSVGV